MTVTVCQWWQHDCYCLSLLTTWLLLSVSDDDNMTVTVCQW